MMLTCSQTLIVKPVDGLPFCIGGSNSSLQVADPSDLRKPSLKRSWVSKKGRGFVQGIVGLLTLVVLCTPALKSALIPNNVFKGRYRTGPIVRDMEKICSLQVNSRLAYQVELIQVGIDS